MPPVELAYPLPSVPPATPNLAPAPGGHVYENVLTGVTARVEGGRLLAPLPRASFAALELADAFHLPAAFLEAWHTANREAARRFPDAPRLPAAHGEAFWRYRMSKHALRLAWPTIDIAILDLLLFRRREGREVARVLVWPERASALVLPAAADLVVVRRDALAPRPDAPPVDLLRRGEVVTVMGPRALRYEQPVPHWLYRGGEAHGALVAELRGRSGQPARDFTAVRAVDVLDAEV